MARKVSESERVEAYFMAAEKDAARLAYDRVTLILRTRGVIVLPTRKRKAKVVKDAA